MIHLRVGDIVTHNAQRSPDAAALIEDDRVISWRELDLGTNRLANGLASLGLVAWIVMAPPCCAARARMLATPTPGTPHCAALGDDLPFFGP